MSDNGMSTVMGPAMVPIPHNSLLSPPILKPESDRLQWREDLRDWSSNIIACAEGGDTRAKGVASCLGLTVYRSLDISLKEQIKESVRCGEIVLKASNEGSTSSQLKTLEKIISIIAKDTPVDRVTRMVRLNTQVHKCIRREGESIKQYINRFKAPALAYLNLTRNGQDSSESQVFAMTLILNAKLPAQTFSNLLSSIINNVSSKKRETSRSVSVQSDRLEKIAELMKQGSKANEENVKECIVTVEAAINAQTDSDEKDEQGGYISLQDAIYTLEAAGLEQKDLVKTDANTNEKSTALMARHRPAYNNNYRYERPPYGRRLSHYRDTRYRQSEMNPNTQKRDAEKDNNNDLRQIIEKNRSATEGDERQQKRARNSNDVTDRLPYFQ